MKVKRNRITQRQRGRPGETPNYRELKKCGKARCSASDL